MYRTTTREGRFEANNAMIRGGLSVDQAWLYTAIPWEILKSTNAWVPPPEIRVKLVWGTAQAGSGNSSPGDASEQPSLRTTGVKANAID